MIKEKDGIRYFERISRWNAIDYTVVSRNNRFAEYSDNYHTKDTKLNLTCFKYSNQTYPLEKFTKLAEPIILEDRTSLYRVDPETKTYLELSGDKEKIRLYKEVI